MPDSTVPPEVGMLAPRLAEQRSCGAGRSRSGTSSATRRGACAPIGLTRATVRTSAFAAS